MSKIFFYIKGGYDMRLRMAVELWRGNNHPMWETVLNHMEECGGRFQGSTSQYSFFGFHDAESLLTAYLAVDRILNHYQEDFV